MNVGVYWSPLVSWFTTAEVASYGITMMTYEYSL